MVRFALPKGRLLGESLNLLREVGIFKGKLNNDRKLLLEGEGFSFLLVKPSDVPLYVEEGVADLGICGLDVIREKEPNTYNLLNLNFGRCKMVVAGRREKLKEYREKDVLRVATKYENVAKKFFKGREVKVLKLSGSVEIAPLVGLADVIVDITQTGRTLRENGLVVFEEIFESHAYLIANRGSFRNKREEVLRVVLTLEEALYSRA